ncbi:MAG: hypothetical protein LBV17_07975 [Treponema sp.]|jgi:hypothetical protein|nr:hypothetical protein [Treponema sp.]
MKYGKPAHNEAEVEKTVVCEEALEERHRTRKTNNRKKFAFRKLNA